MSISTGYIFDDADFTYIKTALNELMTKRSFGTTPMHYYTVSASVYEGKALSASDMNNLANPYQRWISSNATSTPGNYVNSGDVAYPSQLTNILTHINAYKDYHNNSNLYDMQSGGCGNYCAGLCVTVCANGCRTGCDGYCGSVCSVGCTSGCSGDCYSECTSCSGSCTYSCQDNCTGCSSSCSGTCSGDGVSRCGKCIQQCGAQACESSCNSSCLGRCSTSCNNECSGHCGGFCSGGCQGNLEQGNWSCALPVSYFSTTVTFNESQYWTVPSGVYSIYVFAVGGGGGSANVRTYWFEDESGTGETAYYYTNGSGGGFTTYQKISVTPGESLFFLIGAGGGRGLMNYNRHLWERGAQGGNSILFRGSSVLQVARGGNPSERATGATDHGDPGIGGSGGGSDSAAGGSNGYGGSSNHISNGQRNLSVQTVDINGVSYAASTQGSTTCPFNGVAYGAGGGGGGKQYIYEYDPVNGYTYVKRTYGGFGGSYGGGNGNGYLWQQSDPVHASYEEMSAVDGYGGGGGGSFSERNSVYVSWYNTYGLSGDGGNGTIIIAY